MSRNMGAVIHIKEMLQHSHLSFNVEGHKIPCVGTRPFHDIPQARWFALHFFTHNPISLIMFKNSKYANQT